MLLEILLTLVSVLCFIFMFVIGNLLRKLEAYIDAFELQTTYLIKINKTILDSRKSIDELDSRGTFQSDDEVGFFFEGLKNIQEEHGPLFTFGNF